MNSGLDILLDTGNTPFKTKEAMAEAIETNVSRQIVDERQIDPAYFDKMSKVLVTL